MSFTFDFQNFRYGASKMNRVGAISLSTSNDNSNRYYLVIMEI